MQLQRKAKAHSARNILFIHTIQRIRYYETLTVLLEAIFASLASRATSVLVSLLKLALVCIWIPHDSPHWSGPAPTLGPSLPCCDVNGYHCSNSTAMTRAVCSLKFANSFLGLSGTDSRYLGTHPQHERQISRCIRSRERGAPAQRMMGHRVFSVERAHFE